MNNWWCKVRACFPSTTVFRLLLHCNPHFLLQTNMAPKPSMTAAEVLPTSWPERRLSNQFSWSPIPLGSVYRKLLITRWWKRWCTSWQMWRMCIKYWQLYGSELIIVTTNWSLQSCTKPDQINLNASQIHKLVSTAKPVCWWICEMVWRLRYLSEMLLMSVGCDRHFHWVC